MTREIHPNPVVRFGRVATVVISIASVVLLALALWRYQVRERESDEANAIPAYGDGGVFTRADTDKEELARVTEAVSRVIAAPESDHVRAVETLESVAVHSIPVVDFKTACVNTYRGMINAQLQLHELQSLVLTHLDAGTTTPAVTSQAESVQHTLDQQIELIRQSKDRCLDLYTAATSALGISAINPQARP